MKRQVLALMAFTLGSGAVAQVEGGSDEFAKLFDLYAFEKYEDCAYKAESYSMKDKYKRAPEPYLYMAMCFWQIALDPDLEEKYPKAKKDAMKQAYKFKKKDDYMIKKKSAASLYDQNKDFFEDLKLLGVQEGNHWLAEGKYSKASYWFRTISKWASDDDHILFMKGICDILNRNVGEGKMALDKSLGNLNGKYKDANYKASKLSEEVLRAGFILYSDYLNETEQVDSAKATIVLAQTFFTDNRDITNQYNKLHGLPPLPPPKDKSKEKEEIKKIYRYHVSEDPEGKEEEEDDE